RESEPQGKLVFAVFSYQSSCCVGSLVATLTQWQLITFHGAPSGSPGCMTSSASPPLGSIIRNGSSIGTAKLFTIRCAARTFALPDVSHFLNRMPACFIAECRPVP